MKRSAWLPEDQYMVLMTVSLLFGLWLPGLHAVGAVADPWPAALATGYLFWYFHSRGDRGGAIKPGSRPQTRCPLCTARHQEESTP